MQPKPFLHPFDLDLTSLSDIRKEFLVAENDHTRNGLTIEVIIKIFFQEIIIKIQDLTHLLVHKLNADSGYVHNLLKNYDSEYHKQVHNNTIFTI